MLLGKLAFRWKHKFLETSSPGLDRAEPQTSSHLTGLLWIQNSFGFLLLWTKAELCNSELVLAETKGDRSSSLSALHLSPAHQRKLVTMTTVEPDLWFVSFVTQLCFKPFVSMRLKPFLSSEEKLDNKKKVRSKRWSCKKLKINSFCSLNK